MIFIFISERKEENFQRLDDMLTCVMSGLLTTQQVDFLHTVAISVVTIWLVQTECQVEHNEALYYLNNSVQLREYFSLLG